MKNSLSMILLVAISLLGSPVFSQQETQEAEEKTLGLPGDNLDLYAVLNLFQKSKTIEDFEKSLNLEKTGINNLDLNLDEKVDFIKVTTKQDGKDFTFILQDHVNETEVQDVAVIMVSKDEKGKVTLQVVGDEDLYGKNYVVEPKPAATPNPAYTGTEPVKVTTESTTSVVVVESAPIVQYVYSPAYVPYYPPYSYVYHPPYFAAFTIMAVGIYRHNNYYSHGGYHGGHGGNVYIHNGNNYNHYNNSRNSSNTVNHNKTNGNYNRNNVSNRQGAGNNASTRQGTGGSRDASAGARPSTNDSRGSSASDRSSASSRGESSDRSSSDRSSSRSSASRSNPGSFSGSSSRGGGSSFGGGGGGGFRGGGGGGRRR